MSLKPRYAEDSLTLIRETGEVSVKSFAELANVSHATSMDRLLNLRKLGFISTRYVPTSSGGSKALYRCIDTKIAIIPPKPVWCDLKRLVMVERWI